MGLTEEFLLEHLEGFAVEIFEVFLVKLIDNFPLEISRDSVEIPREVSDEDRRGLPVGTSREIVGGLLRELLSKLPLKHLVFGIHPGCISGETSGRVLVEILEKLTGKFLEFMVQELQKKMFGKTPGKTFENFLPELFGEFSADALERNPGGTPRVFHNELL